MSMIFEPLDYPHVAPTLLRAEYFYPRQDAEVLRRAMKGIGTDEKAIITILVERTNKQRLEIGEEFKKSYDKDLLKNLKSELSGDFRDLVTASMTPIPELLAKDLHSALNSVPPNLETTVEILCLLCNSWMHDLSATYAKIFETSLESSIRGCALPGSIPRVLATMSRGIRDEEIKVDEDAAIADAQALVAAVHALRNGCTFLASRLYSAMAGLGTNERALNRLILVRAELDLEDIKQAFVIQYKKSLAAFVEGRNGEWKLRRHYCWMCLIFCRIWTCPLTCSRLQGDTSGDYKRMLLAIIK
ncbi:hypothetical protein B566_EDAN000962 [Ephemera danica]|nr:hypothetical protein B566_EDAN000962 [Ephemera danica]